MHELCAVVLDRLCPARKGAKRASERAGRSVVLVTGDIDWVCPVRGEEKKGKK